MQFAKDSFYIALRDRLATVNPARRVTVEGVVRPAVMVSDNEGPVRDMDNVFVLSWREAGFVGNGTALMKMTCAIEYGTRGVSDSGGDRGRSLGTLDSELQQSAQPPRVQKTDYTTVPPRSLSTMMFWTDLEYGAPKDEAGRISRTAKTTVYFYSEVEQ